MKKEEFEHFKNEFYEIIRKEKRLPKPWEIRFSNGEDVRVWFDKLSKVEQFQSFTDDVYKLLEQYDFYVLSDQEKEVEFLNCILNIKRIPKKDEMYFSDNSEMINWYMFYKKKHPEYETIIHNNLNEFLEMDMAILWDLHQEEFYMIINKLKRIPEHGEAYLECGIDVRSFYDKLCDFDYDEYIRIEESLQPVSKPRTK